ncbi:glycosyltransferase family 2 protein [bacterium D16-51]|nr:glycosyltransferase family 2 protein [bacterium D16-59]RKI62779.1 glycosyltransferase family 2 protein [bacterium D16-51]
MERISVIIPCYNVKMEIDRLMESLFSQTVGAACLEIILINDASTDGTWESLMKWEGQYKENIILVNSECHKGPGAARNIGLDFAGGEYISFLDADDWIAENYYERMVGLAKLYCSDIVICGHDRPIYFDRDSLKSQADGEEKCYDLDIPQNRKQYLQTHIYATSVCWVLYRREFLQNNTIYFPEGILYEDAYFAYVTFFLAEKIVECSDVLYHYYRNMHGIMIGGNEGENRERLVGLRMFYDQCLYHGWLNGFSDEIELIFIRKYYVEMMEVMFRRFQEIDYSVYLGIRDWLLEHFPNCIDNQYLREDYSEMDNIFLKFIVLGFSKEQIHAARKAFLSVVYHKDAIDSFCAKETRKFAYPQKEEMFVIVQSLLEEDFSEEEFKKKVEQLQYFQSLSEKKSILKICQDREEELPGDIYRYIIEKEFVFSYLKEYIRRQKDILETGEKKRLEMVLSVF